MRNFPSPHVHPESLDSASTLESFARREVELGSGAFTATDHGSMGACRQVYDLAKKNDLIPILGVEAYFRDDNDPILREAGIQDIVAYNKYYHLTLHAKNEEAYRALSRVLSNAAMNRTERHGSEEKPLFDWRDLEELGQYDVTVGAGCLVGMVQRHLIGPTPRADLAIKYFEKLRGIFRPGNLFVEVFPHKTDKQWVNGVVVTFEDGSTKRYWPGKKLKTNAAEEVEASSIAGSKKHTFLLAQKDYSSWTEVNKPISKVEIVRGYVSNECSPFAPDGDTQRSCNLFMVGLAKRYKAPVLISDDAHFAYPEDKIVQDCRLGGAQENWKFYSSYHRHTAQEAQEHFRSTMHLRDADFEQWVENAHQWAQGFKGFTFSNKPSLPTRFYPQDTLAHTYKLIAEYGRYDANNPDHKRRLDAEIEILHRNGTLDLLPYFFLGEDANRQYVEADQITGPGRGSAAGLFLAYLLGITHIDPIEYELSSERFITLDRIRSGKLPDIDQDFPDRKLLCGVNDEGDGDWQSGWLFRRFGDSCAQISTNSVLRCKSSIKDVSRALRGHVPAEIEQLTSKMPTPPQGVSDHDFVFGYHTDDGRDEPGAIDTSDAFKEYVRKYPEDWKIVCNMLGITRQKSRHASGFVVANDSIVSISPIQKISGVPCTQYTAGAVESSGGIKMDFLVVRSLLDIQGAIRMVQDRLTDGGKLMQFPLKLKLRSGVVPKCRLVPVFADGKWRMYDVWNLPKDKEVFRDISSGKTETVFQFNTNSAKQWLGEFDYVNPHTKEGLISSVSDMAVFTALDRPGPLDAHVTAPDGSQHNMLQEYAYRARGEDPVGEIPALNDLLPETYGLMVYQEQLQKVYKAMVGCSGSEAEEFRSNVAKKKMDKVNKAYGGFIAGATPKIGETAAKALWDTIVTWGQYGFNKSHAVSYATIAYACAWLKRNYPLEWWCSVLQNASKEKIASDHWRYCKTFVDAPDIKHSQGDWCIVGKRIKAPLGFLTGVGPKAQAQLTAGIPYADIDDFCSKIVAYKAANGRSALNSGVIEKLVVTGVLDSLFSQPLDLLEKMGYIQRKLAELEGKKRAAPVSQRLLTMSPLEAYVAKKKVLPIFGADIRQQAMGIAPDRFSTVGDRHYVWHDEDHHPLVDLEELEKIERRFSSGTTSVGLFDSKAVTVGIVAYVREERRFSWNDKKTGKKRTAIDLACDLEGSPYNWIIWPNQSGATPTVWFQGNEHTQPLDGTVCLLVLSKFSDDKPFTVQNCVPLWIPKEADDGE